MARDLYARLTTAARQLSEAGHDDSAAALEAVLAPRGWAILRASVEESGQARPSWNLSLFVAPALRDALKAAAESTDTSLGTVATAGLQRFVADRFEPPVPFRSGGKKVNLNMRVDKAVFDRAAERVKAVSEEEGYTLTVAWVALSWLLEEFSLNYDGTQIDASASTD